METIDQRPTEGNGPPASANSRISAYALFLAALLSLGLVALNHDFDVVGGRIENTVTSGGGLEEQAGVEQGIGRADMQRKLGLLIVVLVGILALVGKAPSVRLRFDPLAALAVAALCWTAASWIWSASRHETAIEVTRLFAFTFAGAAIVRRFCLQEVLVIFLTASLVSIGVDCAADIAAGTFQPWTQDFRLGGSLHPNHMGRLGAIVALFGFAGLAQLRLRKWSWALFGAGFLVVFMSGSRSGLAGLAAGLAAFQLISVSRRRIALGAASGAAVAAAGLLVFAVLPPFAHRQITRAVLMGRTEDAGSLTGRLPLWHEMWRDAAGRYWQGHGYGAYWTVDRNYDIAAEIEWFPHHSHSAYMELFIDLGIIGLAIVLALAFIAIVRMARAAAITGRIEYRLLAALMVCALANGFFEVGFSTPRFEGFFIGMSVLVLILRDPTAVNAASANQHIAATTRSRRRSLELRTDQVLRR